MTTVREPTKSGSLIGKAVGILSVVGSNPTLTAKLGSRIASSSEAVYNLMGNGSDTTGI